MMKLREVGSGIVWSEREDEEPADPNGNSVELIENISDGVSVSGNSTSSFV